MINNTISLKERFINIKNPFGILKLPINIYSDDNLIRPIITGYYSLANNMWEIYKARKVGFQPNSSLSRRVT